MFYQLTETGIVCKLNNESIQAFFKDTSRLAWAPNHELVVDIDENGHERSFIFKDIPRDDDGIKKRLLAIRDFLRQFGMSRSVYDEATSKKTLKRFH